MRVSSAAYGYHYSIRARAPSSELRVRWYDIVFLALHSLSWCCMRGAMLDMRTVFKKARLDRRFPKITIADTGKIWILVSSKGITS